MLQGRPAPDQERLSAEAVAQRRQAGAVGLRVSQSAEVARAQLGPVQHIDANVVVPPLSHGAAGELEQPLLDLGMSAVERVDVATPGFANGTHHRVMGVTQQPVGLRRRHTGSIADAEGRHPQACLETRRVDLVSEPGVSLRKPVVRFPGAYGSLISVIELDVAKEPAIERLGAELHVREHIGFAGRAAQLGPRAPPRGGDRLREALLVDRRWRDEDGTQRLESVTLRVEAQPHPGGVALGPEGPWGQPIAYRLHLVRRQLYPSLPRLARVKRDGEPPATPREPAGRVARDTRRIPRSHRHDAARVTRVGAVQECDE